MSNSLSISKLTSALVDILRTKTHTTKNTALSLLSFGYAKLNCLPLLLCLWLCPALCCVRFGRPTHAGAGANRTKPLSVS